MINTTQRAFLSSSKSYQNQWKSLFQQQQSRNSIFQQQSRSVVRLVKKDDKLSSFDVRDAPLEKVNPFNLPAPLNNAAGKVFCLSLGGF